MHGLSWSEPGCSDAKRIETLIVGALCLCGMPGHTALKPLDWTVSMLFGFTLPGHELTTYRMSGRHAYH